MKFRSTFYILFVLILLISCQQSQPNNSVLKVDKTANEAQFILRLQEHLDAVSNKDLATLETTLSPNGEMQLILPSSEIIYTKEKFMDFHKEWFQDSLWTFDTKILNIEVDEHLGMAITEVVYREPERNGAPYFNRMSVSYVLKKIDGQWYIIKDHASSIEKTELK